MYRYEIKPTLCSQLVVRSDQNPEELCINISGYRDDPYADTIIPKDVMNDLLGQNNFKKMISNHISEFTYSIYRNKPFICIGFQMGLLCNDKDKIFISLKSNDSRTYMAILEIDDIIQPIKNKL